MKIFIDSADIEQIKPIYETGLIDGITTNQLLFEIGRTLEDVAQSS